jgi:F0F1-type ATP synthase assembly protein I
LDDDVDVNDSNLSVEFVAAVVVAAIIGWCSSASKESCAAIVFLLQLLIGGVLSIILNPQSSCQWALGTGTNIMLVRLPLSSCITN